MKFKPRHTLRRSQAISTFGPGSVVDLRNESVMIGGIDFWPDEYEVVIHEPNLEKALGVSHFRSPSTTEISGNGRDLPAVYFPKWMVCPRCHRLASYSFFAGSMHKPGHQIKCSACNRKVYPARLIVACRNGHIDDFPWVGWVKNGGKPCTCDRSTLELVSSGRTATLADLIVRCKSCGGRRSLAGATRKENIKFLRCSGNRPWLGDQVTDCDADVIPLQRGASNVYFADLTSSISIPPWSKAVNRELDKNWQVFKHVPETAIIEVIEGMHVDKKLNLPAEEVARAIGERLKRESSETPRPSENDIRMQEMRALRQPGISQDLQDDFKTRSTKVHKSLKKYIKKVVQVNRLREVRVLLGFTRIDAPDPAPDARFTANRASISRGYKSWLPGLEVFGEGIYIELDPTRLETWEKIPEVKIRAIQLHKSYLKIAERRGWEHTRNITPRFLLTHSFAHILIRQLSLESGYSSASIRERLYVFNEEESGIKGGVTGFLVYTSTPDSEGSLGGLVRQGETNRLAGTIFNALKEATWCSSDPLCIETTVQGLDSLNLAACHACLLLSETCCEEYNRLLDRAMIVGTLDNPETGFFQPLLEE